MTSPNGSSPEDRLTDALQRTADQAAYDATSLSTISTRAARIRRQGRRRAALAAAAAVAVVAVPTAVLLRPDAEPVPAPLDRAPSTTSTPSVPSPPKPTKSEIERLSLDPQHMPVGPPPKLGYVAAGDYIAPDGARIKAPNDGGPLGQIAAVGNELLFTETTYGMFNEGERTVVSVFRQDAEGATSQIGCADGLHAGNSGTVAYLTSFCAGAGSSFSPELYVVDATGRTSTRPLPDTSGYLELLMFRGDEAIVRDSTTRQLWAVAPPGEPRRIEALIPWKPKDSEIVSFSPDSRYVLLRGTNWPGYSIADAATGNVNSAIPLTQFSGRPGLTSLTWEDDEHLLGIYPEFLDAGDGVTLLRVNLGGVLEVARKDLPADVRLANAKDF